MIDLSKYLHLNGTDVKVFCVDGQVFAGCWSEIFSAEDNAILAEDNGREPPGESILIDTFEGVPTEIYAGDIARIVEV